MLFVERDSFLSPLKILLQGRLSMHTSSLNYIKGLLWFLLSLIVSCGNDTLTKYLGQTMNYWQITFFRYFFGTCILLFFMFYHKGKQNFTIERLTLHLVRGTMLFIAMCLWNYGVNKFPIANATIMSFTVPIFVLLLAPIFLKERVTWPMWAVVLISFGGILLAFKETSQWSFNHASWTFVFAACIFGSLDIINKKYVIKEPILYMIFYPTLIVTFLSAIPVLYVWQTPSSQSLILLVLLGIGSNLIFYLILKAFSLVNASLLAPFRYLELLISICVGYLLFGELPNINILLSAIIIIPCSLFIIYQQGR